MTVHETAVGSSLVQALDEAESVVHSDPAAAEALLNRSRTEASARGLPELAGRASYLHARVLAERGDYDAALARIVEARDFFDAAGQGLMAARTGLGRMHILDDLGRHSEALEVGEALLDGLANVAPRDDDEVGLKAMIEAAARGNTGIALGFLGEHARSLEAYERAEAGYAALGMSDQVAMWQANRGIELISLGEAYGAGILLAEAADAFGEAGDRLWQAKCRTYLAEASRLTGDVVGALALLADAQHVLEDLGASAELVRVHLQRGRVYLDAGLGREATAAAGAAVTIAAESGMVADEAHAHLIAARAALAADDLDQSAWELGRAEVLFQVVGNTQFQARSRIARGELYARSGHRAAAAAMHEETVAQLRAGGWLIPAGWALLGAYDAEGAAETRERLLAEAVVLAEELSLPDLAVAVQHRQAGALAARGEPDAAASELRRARARIAQLGSAYHEPSLMTAFHASKRSVSDDLVQLLAVDGGPAAVAEALAVSDDAKAQTLADLVASTLGNRAADPGAAVGTTQIDRMRAELSGVYAALHDASDASRRDVLRARADALEAAIVDEHVRRSVSTGELPVATGAHPVVGGTDRAPGIAFHVVGDDIVAFVVDGADAHGSLLRGAYAEVRRLTGSLASQWSRMEVGGPALVRLQGHLLRSTQALLADLYDVLLAPLCDHLAGVGGERLVIAPDRLLHRVPFHALFDGEQYVIDRWAVTLAPTTRPRTTSSTGARPTDRPVVVGVADERAPDIAVEARQVAEALPGATLLLDGEATVAAVTAAVPGASLVHLACHGMYRSENALFSSLRLADRWWTCSEVLDLDLTGATVVLTACESGRSGDTAEPVGLAWGFLATGATAAVVSQWVLDDRASIELMATFYDRLTAGDDVEVALRAAQLAVREDRPHPYFWGPLVHVASPFDMTNAATHHPARPTTTGKQDSGR
jgi:tetratricopeptide (TPR) repeat protein